MSIFICKILYVGLYLLYILLITYKTMHCVRIHTFKFLKSIFLNCEEQLQVDSKYVAVDILGVSTLIKLDGIN